MNIKKFICLLITFLSFSNLAYATTPGVYLGAGAGYSLLSNFTDATRKGDGGIGGQLMIGYNFNRYFGTELGYRLYGTTTYAVDGYSYLTFDYHLQALSLVAKGYLPVGEQSPFDLYALLGAAEIFGDGNVSVGSMKLSSSNHAFVATTGLGMTYNINKNVVTAFEYTFTGGKSGSENHIGIPQSHLLTLNVIYHFV